MHKYETMLSYCLKCRKNTENINPKISGTSNGKTMMLSNCAIYALVKKSIFIKKQEGNEATSKISLLGNALF